MKVRRFRSTLPATMAHAIATALVAEDPSRPEIMRRSGATLEQVRTIQRHLAVLSDSG